MKKNYCLWILLSCNVFLAQAQLVKVERSYKINKETPGFYPVLVMTGRNCCIPPKIIRDYSCTT